MNIPFAFAKRHGVLVDDTGPEGPRVHYLARTPATALQELRRVLGRPFALQLQAEAEFERRLQGAYEQDATRSDDMMADLGEALDLEALARELDEPVDLLESADDAPIIRLLNAVLGEAIVAGASDIHIEPFETRLAVRLRVDGVMREILSPPAAIAPLVVSRIKIMAKLDIAEKRLPQDGRLSLRVANRPVDVRVSTLPCGFGERVVLRLLDKQAGRLQLEQIGMDPATTARLDALIHRPHGIFLVTGPTGSGKTTTLYAALSRLNDRSRNLMTVEDPIEYLIEGIAQSQVNPRVEMTFARGLRAILRQDPDVVMVGEIRDLETAQIAIQASLTGHLVLSTLHTNTAIGAVTRLRDMGTEPFLLSSSLIGVLAQRLVRRLCLECRRPRALDEATRERLGLPAGAAHEIFDAVGCPACKHAGFRGRMAVYELVVVDDELRRMIHDGEAEAQLEAHARRSTPGLVETGARAVLAGLTSAEELLRVIEAA